MPTISYVEKGCDMCFQAKISIYSYPTMGFPQTARLHRANCPNLLKLPLTTFTLIFDIFTSLAKLFSYPLIFLGNRIIKVLNFFIKAQPKIQIDPLDPPPKAFEDYFAQIPEEITQPPLPTRRIER